MAQPDFNVRHRDYAAMAKRWEMAWDFWRGGVHVLSPDHDAGVRRDFSAAVDAEETEGKSGELTRKTSSFQWSTTPSRSYLHSNANEQKEEFVDRQIRATHLPAFQAIVNIFVAGILKTGPTRGDTPEVGEPWETLWWDIDRAGTNVDAFIRQCLAMALVFGRCHVLVDQPKPSRKYQSLAEQKKDNLRPYAQVLSPLDLVDWRIDDYGRFMWAVVQEIEADTRDPGYEPEDEIKHQYRVWTPERWTLYQQKGDGDENTPPAFVAVESDTHKAGEVPIATLWACRANRTADMFCESPLADVLDMDRHLLNKLSELDEVERTQTFSLLWLPEMEGIATGPVDLSPYRAFTGDAQAGPPQYVSPPNDLADGKWGRIQSQLWAVRQLAGVGRGKAEYSKEERSAAAITVESEDKRNQMAAWAASTEELDRAVHRLFCAYHGKQPDDYPAPKYGRDYDVKAVMTQIQEFVQLATTQALGPEAMAHMVKPITGRMLKEQGVSNEVITKVEAAIDKQVADAEKEKQERLSMEKEAMAMKAQGPAGAPPFGGKNKKPGAAGDKPKPKPKLGGK